MAASITQVDLTPGIPGRITALTFGSRAEILAIGTEEGKLYHFDLGESASPVLVETTQASEPRRSHYRACLLAGGPESCRRQRLRSDCRVDARHGNTLGPIGRP